MTETAKIIVFTVWHIQLPVQSRRDHGIGSVEQAVDLVILKLTSEWGAVGFGEAASWSVFTGSAEASFAALHRYIRPLVVGKPIAERGAIMAQAQKAVAHCTEAKAALESALLDLASHVSGLSVAALLGGLVQPRIALSCSIANPDFEADKALLYRLSEDKVGL